jgi:hypothetical protein
MTPQLVWVAMKRHGNLLWDKHRSGIEKLRPEKIEHGYSRTTMQR